MPTSEAVLKAWDDYLTPNVMQRRMQGAAVFITSFEVLKDIVIAHPLDFISLGWEGDRPTKSPRYKEEVLSLDKNDQAHASLLWWRNAGAIDDADIDTFKAVRTLRNKVVHEMGSTLTEEWLDDVTPPFILIRDLLLKVERWWVAEIEIPTSPDFDGEEIDRNEIQAGSVMNLELMHQAVYAPEALDKLREGVNELLGRPSQ